MVFWRIEPFILDCVYRKSSRTVLKPKNVPIVCCADIVPGYKSEITWPPVCFPDIQARKSNISFHSVLVLGRQFNLIDFDSAAVLQIFGYFLCVPLLEIGTRYFSDVHRFWSLLIGWCGKSDKAGFTDSFWSG